MGSERHSWAGAWCMSWSKNGYVTLSSPHTAGLQDDAELWLAGTMDLSSCDGITEYWILKCGELGRGLVVGAWWCIPADHGSSPIRTELLVSHMGGLLLEKYAPDASAHGSRFLKCAN